MKKLWKPFISWILSVAMIVSMLPHTETARADEISDLNDVLVLQDSADPNAKKMYVSDVITASGKNKAEAEAKIKEAGYIVSNGNLNEGAGDYMCLGYKLTESREEAITGLKLMTMNGGYEEWDYREFLRENTEGITAIVEGMKAACKKMKGLLDAGDVAAKVAYDTLNVLCVPETSKERTGAPLGEYLLSSDRTYDDYETLILVIQGSTLTFINNQLAVGCSNCYDNEGGVKTSGWVSAPYWLSEVIQRTTEKLSSVTGANDPEEAAEELVAEYAVDIDLISAEENFTTGMSSAAIQYLKETATSIIYNGVKYTSVYNILTKAPRALVACFVAALPASIPAKDFAKVVTSFVADPQSKIPGDTPALPEVVSPLFEKAVNNLNASYDDPFSEDGRATILEKYKNIEEELGFFVTLIQNFISTYQEQKEELLGIIREENSNLTTEEVMAEYSRRVSEYNSGIEPDKQLKSDMMFYIGPYEVLRTYRFVEKDFLAVTRDDGAIDHITDLGAYFELIAETAETDAETAKALSGAIIEGFSDADRYLAKTVGLPLFIMDACISPSNKEKLTNQVEESKGVLQKAYAELGYASNECTVWVGTNKDMLETEMLARTDATIRAAEEDKLFNDQLMKAQADKHAMDGINDAMQYCGIAIGVLGVFISVYMTVTSISFGAFMGLGSLTALGLFTLGGGGAAWGLGMAGMVAAVSGLFAIILIALLIIAVIVLLILMLIKKKKKKEEKVERTPIPTIMMDCTLDVNNQNIKYATRYDVVRDVEGKAADLNLEKCNYWNALYYTRSEDGLSPIMCPSEGVPFALSVNSMEGPEKSIVVSNFGYREAYNLNTRANTGTAIYLHCFTEDSINGITQKGQGAGKYIESLTMAVASRKDLARSAILSKSKDYVIFDYDLSPNTDYYTYVGYSTTDDPTKAITDIRASQGTTSFSMQWGDSNAKYVCVYDKNDVTCPIKTPGSATIKGDDTHFVYQLYTSKSESVGDPILTNSLMIVSDLDDVPEGYEYARWFSGGAFDFVSEARDRDYFTTHRFLCYAPEEEYRYYDTDTEYLAGFGFFSGSTSWLGDSAENLQHSAEDMGFTIFAGDLTPGAMNDGYDKTFIGYATTHNPKKAITDIGVFTGEPGSEGMLTDTIARAGEFFASCIVFASGDKGYSDGESKVRSIRTSHAYVTKVAKEAYMCGGSGWGGFSVRPRAMYVCGPRQGIEPIHLSDVLYSENIFAVPSSSGQNRNLYRLNGSEISGGVGTGWKTVHSLDNYFYDEYDESGNLLSHGSNMGVMRPNVAAGDSQLYIYFKNNTPNLVRGKYIKSIEIVGSDDEKGAFDSARYQAMGAGEEIINLSKPLFSDPDDRFDLSDDSIIYRSDNKTMKGYAKSCTFLVVSYQDSSSGSVGEVRIAYQDGETELPAATTIQDADGNNIQLLKGKYIAPVGFKRGEKHNTEKSTYSKGYVLYTSTSGDHIGRVAIVEDGETGYDSGGIDYRLLQTLDGDIFAANGGYEQAVAMYFGTLSTYISDIIITDAAYILNAKMELAKEGYTQFIVADLMGGNAPNRYHLGIARTSTASKAIKDIRIVNELLPVEKDSNGNPELLNGKPYSLIDGRPFTRVNDTSLTYNVEGSETPVYIYITRGNTLEQGKGNTKELRKYPERVAITNIGLRYKLGSSKQTETYWNGISTESPITTLPPSMTESTTVLTAGGCKKATNGTYKYNNSDGVLNGDSYKAMLRFKAGDTAWIESHGLSYMVYTNNSGLSMLNYEKAYNAGYLTGTKDGDEAILSPTTPAVAEPTTPAVTPTKPAPSTSPANSSTADDGTGKAGEAEKNDLDIGTLVSENLGVVTIIVIAAGLVATGIVLLSAKKKKENRNK